MLKSVSRVWRFIYITYVMTRYGLGYLLLTNLLAPGFSLVKAIIYMHPGHWFRRRYLSRGESIRLALTALGPIFVKFGQTLSTRADLIPQDIMAELTLLQDKVPPFPGALAINVVEQQYGKGLHEVFRHFESVPLGSASIAQVHEATLLDGQSVIVKILRPDIEKIIQRDVELMFLIASLVNRFGRDTKRFRITEVVEEFQKTIFDELDLFREAANASQLRRNFLNSHMLYIPEIYWPYVRKRIMVQEKIQGVPIANVEELKRKGVNFKVLAERGVEIFFTQVFRDCFFHADMHPGNLFVCVENPQDPRYLAVDFGIMGSLSKHDQYYLAENFLAFFRRDYRRVAELHVESGWTPYDTRVDEFEAAIRTVCEPIFERPLGEISYGQILLQLFQTGRRFKMEVQPQLILLQKTLLAVEGLGRQLYPELDLWHTAKPYLERWLREQVSIKKVYKRMRINALRWSEQIPQVPNLLYDALTYVRQRKIDAQLEKDHPSHTQKRWPLFVMFLTGIGLGAGAVLARSYFFM
ncbi:MAG: ubiquinone biosynthesis regulatory protein kinase UbiB [Gammaproteobacteria bacterium]